jgi:hypothetical protein
MKINIEHPNQDLLTLKQASEWASEYLGKNVSTFNISYLIQYGKILEIFIKQF